MSEAPVPASALGPTAAPARAVPRGRLPARGGPVTGSGDAESSSPARGGLPQRRRLGNKKVKIFEHLTLFFKKYYYASCPKLCFLLVESGEELSGSVDDEPAIHV